MSNVLGSEIPLKEIIKVAHENNIRVLVDGCQGIAHLDTDVQDLFDCSSQKCRLGAVSNNRLQKY